MNYPGTTKRVTIDVDQLVPSGAEGDEKIVVTASTTAYSDNTARTAIQDLYVTDFKAGWCKSSGLAGTNGKFALDAGMCNLKVKMDATVSGTDGSGYYTITLDHEDGTLLDGEVIAADMEEKIRALTMETADTGYALSYTNASVEFTNGKFYIVSGSISSFYTGANRSSVKVASAATNDALGLLGFDVSMDSESMAAISANEVGLNTAYSNNSTPLVLSSSVGATAGDALMITDGTNTDYFTVLSGSTTTSITVDTSGANAIHHSYTVSGTKVQLLREQDPDGIATLYYQDMDSLGRWLIKSLVNQIDYSS